MWFRASRAQIEAALDAIQDEGKGLIRGGVVSAISREGSVVRLVLAVTPQEAGQKAWLVKACEEALLRLRGIKQVRVVMTAHRDQPASTPQEAPRAVWNREPLPHVARVIAIASGKGGVGKSTTTINLAHALTRLGKRVGVLDADLYGPSLPRMLHLSQKPEMREGRIIPPCAGGIACLSIGLLMEEETALIWRGPQVSKALRQMLRDVAWADPQAPLDVLLVDMPPGTGDIALSLAQLAPVSGAVIVTTPQAVAVDDAKKAAWMFHKLQIPVLGIVENMSGFVDPASGQRHAIFGEGGGEALAAAAQSVLLGSVPVDMALREASDDGAIYPDAQGHYARLAQALLERW